MFLFNFRFAHRVDKTFGIEADTKTRIIIVERKQLFLYFEEKNNSAGVFMTAIIVVRGMQGSALVT